MIVLAYTLYQLRRRGVNKYAMWVPLIAARFFIGDELINHSVW
jgi:hypothetical protein